MARIKELCISVFVCVCVCVRERERERGGGVWRGIFECLYHCVVVVDRLASWLVGWCTSACVYSNLFQCIRRTGGWMSDEAGKKEAIV